ncbi:hypothetical protein GIB67_015821 [Kingdonia uniflora]|uniref:Uncharacterized protein n=1 Tax=Kingdonia uniflora TaxID=39325 RepID=A0A7J7NUN0_9MAGN|nr:hypothetical protein GIB67_015821 [Kingdonia uniflora]
MSDDTKVSLLTPYKLGKFNLFHRNQYTPGIWTKEQVEAWKPLLILIMPRVVSSFARFGMLVASSIQGNLILYEEQLSYTIIVIDQDAWMNDSFAFVDSIITHVVNVNLPWNGLLGAVGFTFPNEKLEISDWFDGFGATAKENGVSITSPSQTPRSSKKNNGRSYTFYVPPLTSEREVEEAATTNNNLSGGSSVVDNDRESAAIKAIASVISSQQFKNVYVQRDLYSKEELGDEDHLFVEEIEELEEKTIEAV